MSLEKNYSNQLLAIAKAHQRYTTNLRNAFEQGIANITSESLIQPKWFKPENKPLALEKIAQIESLANNYYETVETELKSNIDQIHAIHSDLDVDSQTKLKAPVLDAIQHSAYVITAIFIQMERTFRAARDVFNATEAMGTDFGISNDEYVVLGVENHDIFDEKMGVLSKHVQLTNHIDELTDDELASIIESTGVVQLFK